jgi:acetylornithine/succinyldiaminopimelate/putrescine aminotransferase/predicted amino acid dehydrogenase/acyl-coenzyme A synthetase/AMP-(fatty) acid ligase
MNRGADTTRPMPGPDRVIAGPTLAGPLPVRNLTELVYRKLPGESGAQSIFLGTLGERRLAVSLDKLRAAVRQLGERFVALGFCSGDTVCLIRLPRTSETAVAVIYTALSAAGLRVLIPMYVDVARLPGWLRTSGARAVLWAAEELRAAAGREPDLRLLAQLESAIALVQVPTFCFERDLGLSGLLAARATSDRASADERPAPGRGDELALECLVLTTSGSSGAAKLVRYQQGALLKSCASWEQAGLFAPERLGGRGLCLLLAHSMGIRALWNAIWTGQPLCLIPPEWFIEHPARVRDLLVEMRPEHVTGGPAVFRTLLELGRVFPELKSACFASLRCLVSTGARFDPDLSRRIETAFGLPLHNALGMTETMQVASTLVPGPMAVTRGVLGNPLPGVTLRLKPRTDLGTTVHELSVQTALGCFGYLGNGAGGVGHEISDGWFDTGDLVALDRDGLTHLGRTLDDVGKDGFGVKIAASLLASRYAALGPEVLHVEFFPLRQEPGLGALVFLSGDTTPGAVEHSLVDDRQLLDRVLSRIEGRHERFRAELEDFELRHLTVARFVCVAGCPPTTAKGNASRAAVEKQFAAVIGELTGPEVHRAHLRRVRREALLLTDYARFASPRRGALMALARLDKHFSTGQGNRLRYVERGVVREVVDFVGGFGTNLLGHRHPGILAAIREHTDGDGVFLSDQGSLRQAEGVLARKLAELVGQTTGRTYVVRFGSTGAEAVEMALAHAFLERQERLKQLILEQRRLFGGSHPAKVRELEAAMIDIFAREPIKVLTIAKGFHGQSLAARSLLSGDRGRALYGPMTGIEPIYLPADGHVDLAPIFEAERLRVPVLERHGGEVGEGERSFSRVIAAIAEPILGEGGVIEADPELLRRLGGCEFPLIFDEIQCGLGRVGSLVAAEGIPGHYYLLGKALGGGVAKISALLIDRPRYVPCFDEHYASTFSGDPFSCGVARRALGIIEDDQIVARAAERGATLRRRLELVRERYPDEIQAVRGRGLLLGVELAATCADDCLTLRMIRDRDLFGVVASSYLLNRGGVRVLPTLSAPNVLRVEPSAYVKDDEIEALGRALEELAQAIHERATGRLLEVLVEDEMRFADKVGPTTPEYPGFSARIEAPAPGAVRVAFLSHFVLPEAELAVADPGLRELPAVARRALFHKMIELFELKPSIAFARNLFDGRVWFSFILLPVDAATLEGMHRAGYRALAVERIQAGVCLAAAQGCSIAALGAYTSIIADDGAAILAPIGMRVTTGNSLTVAAGVRRLREACVEQQIDPGAAASRLAIVGATGNIGTALAECLASDFSRIALIARDETRLTNLATALGQRSGRGRALKVSIATDLAAVRDCNVIVIATSTNEPLIYPHHLDPARAVIIADISVPGAVSADVRALQSVRFVPLAGVLAVPGAPDFVMASHIRPGTAFCCAAEGMLLGLEPGRTQGLSLIGPIDGEVVRIMGELAATHGFFAG